MAQVGRISGPLLEANLLRQGIANGTQQNLSFKNTNSDTSLLKIDVANGRIGVDLEAPANELQISQTTQTIDLIADTANIGNINMSNTDINVNSGILYLNAAEAIVLSNLETSQFYVSDNFISTHQTNTNIEIDPNGTGTVEVQSDLRVLADLYATGNITLDGNITFGDTVSQDTVDFNADIDTDITPDIDATYNLGSPTKTWKSISTDLVNGQLVTSGAIDVSNISLDSRQGNIFYVGKEGLDTNVGDHPNGALLTIQEAISRCDASTTGPVTIYVYPGEYEEQLPLVIPAEVSIIGVDLRNTVIKPASGYEDKDIFHLNDSSTVTHITIKDFQYNSTNNTGYAFRFAPGAVITKRSPYIQNITVITAGSVTSASDPRGFDEGDAGRGAWIDGAELDSASIEASMLFHSATFITPGADAISMTNGVRVEWLNSFTYFANRGLYAFNGTTGRTTYDGSTVEYGAEVRSIGSANVYGNYGAVADGADTLMYLIQHNMAYIGAGKFVDNDASRAIYANETVELNSGVIHYTTTDHLGGFRIGDNFWVDFETGNTTVNIDTLTVNQFNALVINTGANTTTIDGAYIETGNFTIVDSTIQSNTGDINLSGATGTINLQSNTNITGDLNISGDLSYDGVLNIKGDEASDSLVFNVQFDQDFNPNLHQTYDLGSFEKKWLIAHLNRVEAGDMSFYDNIVTTNVSNADLEIRASGTGNIYIPTNATISNALTVDGTTTINDNINIVDPTFTLNGALTQLGSTTTSEDFVVGENIDVGASAQFEEILVDDNFITTTTSNTDLELRASGTGIVDLQSNVNVDNNLSANDVDTTNVTVTLNTTSDNANIGNIEINDNYIEATSLNGDLTLSADRNIIVTGTDVRIVNDLTVSTDTDLQGTSITGLLSHTGDTTQTGNVVLNGEWTNGNIYIEDNFITTTQLNADLDLRASGIGNIVVSNNNVTFGQDLTVSGTGNDGVVTSTFAGGEVYLQKIVAFSESYMGTAEPTSATWQAIQTFEPGDIGIFRNNDTGIEYEFTVIGWQDEPYRETLDIDAPTLPDTTGFWNNTVTIRPYKTYLRNTSVTGTLAHTGAYNQTGNYTINGELTVDNVYIEDNFITTTTGNLTLGANGTGNIVAATNNVAITNNLDVDGVTNLDVTNIDGNLTHVGDRTQTGNYDIAGELSVDDVYIEDNFITTTVSNADLELRASVTEAPAGAPTEYYRTLNDLNPTYNGQFGSSASSSEEYTVIGAPLVNKGDVNITYNPTNGLTSWNSLTPFSSPYPGNTIQVQYTPGSAAEANFESLTVGEAMIFVDSSGTSRISTVSNVGSAIAGGWQFVVSGGGMNYVVASGTEIEGEIGGGIADTGKVVVYSNTTGNVVQTIENPTNTVSSRFGTSVAINANYLAVGAPYELGASSEPGSGKVYVYSTANWSLVYEIENPNSYTTKDNDYFGISVALSDSYLAVGAIGEDSSLFPDRNDGGVVQLYTLSDGLLFRTLAEASGVSGSTIGNDGFGTSVALTDTHVIIGAPEAQYSAYPQRGFAYLHNIAANTTQTLIPTNNVFVTGHRFGYDVDINDEYVVVGQNRITGTNYVEVFDLSGNSVYTLSGGIFWGASVSIGGSYLAVSQPNPITLVNNNTRLYDLASGTLISSIPNPNLDDPNTTDVFGAGTTISPNGTYLTISAPRADINNFENGIAYTFSSESVVLYGSNGLINKDVIVPTNDVEIANDLTVIGLTSLTNTTITGSLLHTGDRTQTGNYTIAGEISNGNILIEDNFISTTNSNSDLELRASGTGEIVIDGSDTVTINNNLFVGGTLSYQGLLTINGNVTLQGNTQDGSLTVTDNFDVTGTLDISSQAQFEDVRIEDNFITTTLSNSDLELRASGTGEVLIPNNNVQVNNNLFAASISTGDITVNNDLVLDELVITDSNIEINENYVSTKISNADLELRATGNIVSQENTVIEQNLTINGSTSLQNTTITSDLTQTGNLDQTGNYNLTGNLNLSSLVIDSAFQFDDVRVSGNVLETTLSNSNLELRASGTGNLLFQENVTVDNNLSANTLTVSSITVTNNLDLEIIELSTDIQFEDNVITTTNSNSNLELRANGTGKVFLQELDFYQDTIGVVGESQDSTLLDITLAPTENLIIDSTSNLKIPVGTSVQAKESLGDIRFNTTDEVFEGTGNSRKTFGGLYSTDRLTSVTVDPTSNNIRFIINGSPIDSSNLVGEVTGQGLFIHAIQVEDVNLNNNVIKTTNSNADLELRANGTGELVIDDLSISQNNIKNGGNNLIIKNTGFGRTKFAGTIGVVVPSGTTINPSPAPQVGDTRWNTSDGKLETWDGTQYISSGGVASAITAAEFDDLLLEYTLIFG